MLVIEGCAGGDLLDFFTLRKKYNEDHVAQIVRQLSDGLQVRQTIQLRVFERILCEIRMICQTT